MNQGSDERDRLESVLRATMAFRHFRKTEESGSHDGMHSRILTLDRNIFTFFHEFEHDRLFWKTFEGMLASVIVQCRDESRRHGRDTTFLNKSIDKLFWGMRNVQESAATYVSINSLRNPGLRMLGRADLNSFYEERYRAFADSIDGGFRSTYLRVIVARVVAEIALSASSILLDFSRTLDIGTLIEYTSETPDTRFERILHDLQNVGTRYFCDRVVSFAGDLFRELDSKGWDIQSDADWQAQSEEGADLAIRLEWELTKKLHKDVCNIGRTKVDYASGNEQVAKVVKWAKHEYGVDSILFSGTRLALAPDSPLREREILSLRAELTRFVNPSPARVAAGEISLIRELCHDERTIAIAVAVAAPPRHRSHSLLLIWLRDVTREQRPNPVVHEITRPELLGLLSDMRNSRLESPRHQSPPICSIMFAAKSLGEFHDIIANDYTRLISIEGHNVLYPFGPIVSCYWLGGWRELLQKLNKSSELGTIPNKDSDPERLFSEMCGAEEPVLKIICPTGSHLPLFRLFEPYAAFAIYNHEIEAIRVGLHRQLTKEVWTEVKEPVSLAATCVKEFWGEY